ncbi:MAG: hypothetical protein K0R39_3 [Symbiobacteriaceae bacterium]|nr:hypothetical protein [Symbiobacteriaceae bacterium]
MQCDQIRQYLKPYAEGTLPGYKAAWVVQHLAGCQVCAASVATERARMQGAAPPVAAAVEAPGQPAGTEFAAVQRPVPVGLKVAAVALIGAAVVGAFWLLVTT